MKWDNLLNWTTTALLLIMVIIAMKQGQANTHPVILAYSLEGQPLDYKYITAEEFQNITKTIDENKKQQQIIPYENFKHQYNIT